MLSNQALFNQEPSNQEPSNQELGPDLVKLTGRSNLSRLPSLGFCSSAGQIVASHALKFIVLIKENCHLFLSLFA